MRGGFTTVELLVTLFIASMMVVSGYQLYSAVSQRSDKVSNAAEASNLAYSKLRDNSAYQSVATSCTSSHKSGSASTSTAIADTTLPGSPRFVIYRCRPFSYNSVTRVTSVVFYDSPEKESVHAIYVAP